MYLKHTSLAAALALAFATVPSHATEFAGLELTGSGFLTLAGGKMLNGKNDRASDYKRPMFAADYAQGGVYDGRSGLQFKPDSKLGLQGTATFPDRRLSITGQVVARGAQDGNVNLEWLYASYKLNDNFTVQAGRKRIPMFYYSDTQDVGLALPWVHLPSQLYGWEAVNYNGINLTYNGQWGEWSSAVNVMAGNEHKKESGYWKIYRGKDNRTDIKWDDIKGIDLTLSRDWFESRVVYLESKRSTKNVTGTWDGAATLGSTTYGQDGSGNTAPDTGWTAFDKQQILGLAVNIDYNNFLVRSEFITIDHRKSAGYKDFAQILGVGYRFGKWTPMVTVSNYRAQAILSQGMAANAQEAHRTMAYTLRYDLTPSSALKVQYDMQKDRSGEFYTLDGSGAIPSNRFGDARLLTVAYDMVF